MVDSEPGIGGKASQSKRSISLAENTFEKPSKINAARLALLPSKETLSGAYFELRDRIDQIARQAEQQGSLKVALSGLNSIRQTLDSLARLAGHDGADVNVAVQANVHVDVSQIVERFIAHFDHEPETKARIAQALLMLDGERSADAPASSDHERAARHSDRAGAGHRHNSACRTTRAGGASNIGAMIMNNLRQVAYQIDPALWVREVLGITPTAWQEIFLRAPRGASILALTARQVGKTTTAAWAIAHAMVFMPGSLSVIACPAQRQSAEAVRRVRDILLKVGAKLVSDNVYALELDNGSRVLALPGSDDSIRGLTVDAWIVADEAARLERGHHCRLAPDARPPPAGAAGHALDRVEPHRSVLDRLDERRSHLDPVKGDG